MASETAELNRKLQNKFSRQSMAIGEKTTASLTQMKVVVFGVAGLGSEVCKNLVLSGLGELIIIDPQPITALDITTSFLFTKNELGQSRASVAVHRLQELNLDCVVRTVDSLDMIKLEGKSALNPKPVSVLIISQILPLPEVISWNTWSRENNVTFLYALTGGVCGDVFSDAGATHVIRDSDGFPPLEVAIDRVIKMSDEEMKIFYHVPEGRAKRPLENGSSVCVSDVPGLSQLTTERTFQIFRAETDNHETEVRIRCAWENEALLSTLPGGVLREVKQPRTVTAPTLQEVLRGNAVAMQRTNALLYPGTPLNQAQHLLAFVTLHVFFERYGRLPVPHDVADIDNSLSIARDLLVRANPATADTTDSYFVFHPSCVPTEVDECVLIHYMTFRTLELQAMSAFLGGVVSFEVLKRPGTFVPLTGIAHWSFTDALPTAAAPDLPESTEAAMALPQPALSLIYGRGFVDRLSKLRVFLVGCGALGCEYLKNLALHGVACAEDGAGLVTVTDADTVAVSNLSRQFLFRESNVGQSKAESAVARVRHIAPAFHTQAQVNFVDRNNENIYDEAFWQQQDLIVNALDNVETRRYVDRQCVLHHRPLLESGTLGVEAQSYSFIPFITESYEDKLNLIESAGGGDGSNDAIPMCTLRNFPHIVEHCVEWARDLFAKLFVSLPQACSKLCAQPDSVLEVYRTAIELDEVSDRVVDARRLRLELWTLQTLLDLSSGSLDPEDRARATISLAYQLFYSYFHDSICDLQRAFPRDRRQTDKQGLDMGPFWSGTRRFPTALQCEADDPAALAFVHHCAALLDHCVAARAESQPRDWSDPAITGAMLRELRSQGTLCPAVYRAASVQVESVAATADEPVQAPPACEESEKAELRRLLAALRSAVQNGDAAQWSSRISAESFEKDEDDNHHVDFVAAAANMRATNYDIAAPAEPHMPRVSFSRVKELAGRILPALASTTAAICGLVIMQLLTLGRLQTEYSPDHFRADFWQKTTQTLSYKDKLALRRMLFNRRINLGQNRYLSRVMESPLPVQSSGADAEPCFPESFNKWQHGREHGGVLNVPGSLTLPQFAQWLQSEHALTLDTWIVQVGRRPAETHGGEKKVVSVALFDSYSAKGDVSLLPATTLTETAARAELKANPATSKKMSLYMSLWKNKRNREQQTAEQRERVFEADACPGETLTQLAVRLHLWLQRRRAAGDIPEVTFPLMLSTQEAVSNPPVDALLRSRWVVSVNLSVLREEREVPHLGAITIYLKE